MTSTRLDLALTGGVEARLAFTDRGAPGSDGSSRSPFQWSNLGSHVGDDPAAVTANRDALAGTLGVPSAAMAFMHPDHGRGVATMVAGTGTAPGAEVRDVDAMVTDRPGVALVALAADCVPILIVDPQAAVIAAVHSGWRGAALDVVAAAVTGMQRLGAEPGRLVAHLGPAICGSCYPVPAVRVEQVAAVCPAAATRSRDGQPALDLRAGLAARLEQLGARTVLVGGCTAEDSQCYSHRRDGLTGRQGAAIVVAVAGAGA